MSDFYRPSTRRLLVGFLLAPIAPAFLVASFAILTGPSTAVFLFTTSVLLGGYFPMVVVGLPLYALVRRRMKPTWPNCAAAGAFVATLPWALIDMVTGHFSVISAVTQVGLLGGLGAIGGSVFWLVIKGAAPPAGTTI